MATILVVDNDAGHREHLRALLEQYGHRVAAASKGPQALAIITRVPLDAVISELYMEDFDGIELLTAVRKENPDLPIVLMADPARASYQPVSTVASYLGAAGQLTKPADPVHLRELLNRLLGERASA